MAPFPRMKKFYFPVPKELRQSSPIRIHGISIEGDDFVIEFVDTKDKIKRIKSYITGDKHNDIESVRDLVESKLSYFFDAAATEYCTGRLTDVIDRLYDADAAHAIEKIKKHHRAESAKLDGEKGAGREQEKPTFAVKKFSGVTTTSPNGQGLAEAVIINGHPLYACTINGGTSVTFFEELETADMKLRPPTKQEYPPDSAYEYATEDEFMETIRYAQEQDSLYALYRDVRKFYTKDYFVDTEPRNSTLLALYTTTSEFQDKFATVPYIWLIGDNGSGKGSIEMTYAALGYRVFYMAGASGANICEYLGSLEEGAGTLAEDEVNNLDNDEYKKLLYMTGYAAGGCVPKILDGSTSAREQRYYKSYCQKISASENLPSIKYAKGVLDREFVIKCVKGFPRYNIKAIKKKTRTPEVMRLINELQTLRKRLFAYRLVHYDDVIQDIQDINISGRALELTESALQLFYQFRVTQEDNRIFNEDILPTLSSFLNDRLGRRSNSLEGKLYPIMRMMVEAQGTDEFDNDTIYNMVYSELEGRELPGKTDMFYVDDLGSTVTRTKIMKVLKEKFKATHARIVYPDGSTKRGHKIPKETLERIRASYEDQWEIKIGDSTISNDIEETSDQVNHPNQVLDQYGGENRGSCEQVEGSPTTQNLEESAPNDAKTITNVVNPTHHGSTERSENTSPISTIPGLGGLGGQSYSVEDIIISLFKDEQGNKTDYFTIESWRTKLMLLPVQHPYHSDIDQADQTLKHLLQEGKIRELEPGKYSLNSGGAQ